MPGNNAEFANENFNADDFVKKLVKERVAGSELLEYKKQLQKDKEDVSGGLKKKIFENYTQFIETAREISREFPLFLAIFLTSILFIICFRSRIRNVSTFSYSRRPTKFNRTNSRRNFTG
jgi:hypothetical protein